MTRMETTMCSVCGRRFRRPRHKEYTYCSQRCFHRRKTPNDARAMTHTERLHRAKKKNKKRP